MRLWACGLRLFWGLRGFGGSALRLRRLGSWGFVEKKQQIETRSTCFSVRACAKVYACMNECKHVCARIQIYICTYTAYTYTIFMCLCMQIEREAQREREFRCCIYCYVRHLLDVNMECILCCARTIMALSKYLNLPKPTFL